MCIIIDPPALLLVFKAKDRAYAKFKPVEEWLTNNSNIKLVYGGDEYIRQLANEGSILKVFNELKKSRRTAKINDSIVNKIEKEIEENFSCQSFDDRFLAAIVCASGCRLICINDKKAHKYLTDKTVYQPYKVKKPKIYSNQTNKDLLCAQNIVELKNC